MFLHLAGVCFRRSSCQKYHPNMVLLAVHQGCLSHLNLCTCKAMGFWGNQWWHDCRHLRPPRNQPNKILPGFQLFKARVILLKDDYFCFIAKISGLMFCFKDYTIVVWLHFLNHSVSSGRPLLCKVTVLYNSWHSYVYTPKFKLGVAAGQLAQLLSLGSGLAAHHCQMPTVHRCRYTSALAWLPFYGPHLGGILIHVTNAAFVHSKETVEAAVTNCTDIPVPRLQFCHEQCIQLYG